MARHDRLRHRRTPRPGERTSDRRTRQTAPDRGRIRRHGHRGRAALDRREAPHERLGRRGERGLRPQQDGQQPRRRNDRTADQAAVVRRREQARGRLAPRPGSGCTAKDEFERSDAFGRAPRRHHDHPRSFQQDVLSLDRQPPRLVHLAADLVGPPHPGLVQRRRNLRGCEGSGRRRLGTGSRHARYVVFGGVVDLEHADRPESHGRFLTVSRRHARAQPRLPEVPPDLGDGNGLRPDLLLGRAHDPHDDLRDGASAVQDGVLPRFDPHERRQENEQIGSVDDDRSARHHPQVRRRRPQALDDRGPIPRRGQQALRRENRRVPQLREQALERLALHPTAMRTSGHRCEGPRMGRRQLHADGDGRRRRRGDALARGPRDALGAATPRERRDKKPRNVPSQRSRRTHLLVPVGFLLRLVPRTQQRKRKRRRDGPQHAHDLVGAAPILPVRDGRALGAVQNERFRHASQGRMADGTGASIRTRTRRVADRHRRHLRDPQTAHRSSGRTDEEDPRHRPRTETHGAAALAGTACRPHRRTGDARDRRRETHYDRRRDGVPLGHRREPRADRLSGQG